jgi:Short C-terminal domain
MMRGMDRTLPQVVASVDPVAVLEQLGRLRDIDVLTPEEFDAKRAELLRRL